MAGLQTSYTGAILLIAIISDLHGNIEALEACLKKIEELNVEEINCLGDIVGYGPNPRELVQIVMEKCKHTILGNHDEALLKQPINFNKIPREAIYWTKSQFQDQEGRKLMNFLEELETALSVGEIVYSHGMLQSNMNYVEVPEDVLFIFEHMRPHERICFAGHSHLPCIWMLKDRSLYFREAVEGEEYELGDFEKVWVNVGSVGQPRDRDPRSCFATYDEESSKLMFHRIPYNIEKTATKIRKTDGLHEFLADRLFKGI